MQYIMNYTTEAEQGGGGGVGGGSFRSASIIFVEKHCGTFVTYFTITAFIVAMNNLKCGQAFNNIT